MTTTQLIISNYYKLSPTDFAEFIINNDKTLLREDKEIIMEAFTSGFDAQPFLSESDAENYYNDLCADYDSNK